MRATGKVLDRFASAMAGTYAAKTGRPESEMLELVTGEEDFWFSAAEAVENGFCDRVIDGHAQLPAATLLRFSGQPRISVSGGEGYGDFRAIAAFAAAYR
jgi:Clp protease